MKMFEQLFSMSDNDSWRSLVAKYQRSDVRRSIWQVINSFGPYVLLWYLMYRSLDVSYWLTLVLALPAAGFLVRIFIISHDCGHGSFFASRYANDVVGTVSGFLAFIPYYEWRHNHAIHHATGSDLDNRGTGDVWLLTVDEYLALSRWSRFVYRFYRNPLVMFGIGPLFMFLISHRFTSKNSGQREKKSVYWTNAALAGVVGLFSITIGIIPFVKIMLPIIWIAGMSGVWLFYVQHQFEDSYWVRHSEWQFQFAALKGSSFYKLPKILQWFSGNIGFHHIHHLSPRIPNYFLNKCHRESPLFQSVKPLTLLKSFRSLAVRLWDEQHQRYVSFRYLKQVQRPLGTSPR
jgi:acyl-lipid omega-6 desaturase (Delta-12 desaturase)